MCGKPTVLSHEWVFDQSRRIHNSAALFRSAPWCLISGWKAAFKMGSSKRVCSVPLFSQMESSALWWFCGHSERTWRPLTQVEKKGISSTHWHRAGKSIHTAPQIRRGIVFATLQMIFSWITCRFSGTDPENYRITDHLDFSFSVLCNKCFCHTISITQCIPMTLLRKRIFDWLFEAEIRFHNSCEINRHL